MKKIYLFPALAGAVMCVTANAQTSTLFTENFNGNTYGFTLNTTDASSTATGANTWVVNNSYTGGSGTATCQSFSVPFTINNTAQEPAGITGQPTSKYMHILSDSAQMQGITCGCYMAADGFCTMAESMFSKMSSDISTTGYSGVSFNFWWLCGGSANGYGLVYYSTNGGTTWTALSTQYNNSSSAWTQASVTNAAFDNQATLRFGFQFVNNTTFNAADPGFCIDDVTITGSTATGMAENNLVSSVNLFPNPANDHITLTWNGAVPADNKMLISIYDVTGQLVKTETRDFAVRSEMDDLALANGIYTFRVQCGEQTAISKITVAE
ncbi:MAG TPA: T9SS type A sorting domain-containing protein [Bacteroidia bacterium]|nr:T9SS type A sorting domain-containing protein [Bacteroidia bacterium]